MYICKGRCETVFVPCIYRFLRPLSFLVRWFRIRWAARRRRNSHEARQVEIETIIERMPADAAIRWLLHTRGMT